MAHKHQHYVPEFYQRGFSADGERLWLYDRKEKLYRDQHISDICVRRDLYTIKPKIGPRDRIIESKVLSPIEDQSATVLQKLCPGYALNRHDIRKISEFVALQVTRLPAFGDMVSRLAEADAEEWLRLSFATEQRAQDAFDRYPDPARNIDAATMAATIKGGRVKAKATERLFLRHMFSHAETLVKFLERSAWTFLVAPVNTQFVLSDNPFVAVPPEGHGEGVGFALPGVVSYFPINRQLCLEVRHSDYGIRYKTIDSRVVRTINHNVAANSERFIMAADKEHLYTVVTRSASIELDETPRFSVSVRMADDNNSVVVYEKRAGRYFY